MSEPPYIVSLKAFGDFVIACSALRRIADGPAVARPTIVAASHLAPLANAIGMTNLQFVTSNPAHEVPAAFDIRRKGPLAAAISLLELRSRLAKLPVTRTRLFDRLGPRERWLAGRSPGEELPEAPNIYAAYEVALQKLGYVARENEPATRSSIRSAVVVPASRVAAKTLPPATIAQIVDALATFGVATTVLVLEGDLAELPKGVETTTIPRAFPALIERVRAADLVVSADSLAGHLAEFHSKRSFVASLTPNEYWLPASAWKSDGWCRFEDVGRFATWLANGDATVSHAA